MRWAQACHRVLWQRRGWPARLGLLGVASLLGLGVYLGGLQVTGNFHTVIPQELYRSAQPSPAQITAYAAAYGIRSIVNLRGPNPGRDWYDAERATAQLLGIQHVDFAMSAKRPLDDARAAQLIALLRAVPKPVLIHCQAGADRTGLASALYLAAVAGQGEEAAEGQLSVLYGHVGLPMLGPYAMDATFERMEPALGFPDS
ncbi:dual specificity protein phosphatase family protein [Niveispirillum sp. BGYR6]|uniref:dual specificity protein phosphatase family protein n=1 Tax=Niveispirillum sp. BGYR6 TaxID=2971249 RepID=UPI0022B9C8C3|nr:dual specificity protein phosphatase family protein [Niveispirillum sp. BGYR6]MDG5495543.1 dual specificity protein phosphatase family protein [Niveispirillum sp. BGYR6]